MIIGAELDIDVVITYLKFHSILRKTASAKDHRISK